MVEVSGSQLTEEFIVRIYEFLAMCRTKILLGTDVNEASGQIEGYLMCLEDLFGVSSDQETEVTTRNKQDIYSVVDRMMLYMNDDLVPHVRRAEEEGCDFEIWHQASKVVEQLVRDYVIDHFDECVKGIRAL